MSDQELLEMIKVDLGISKTAYDTRLGQMIEAAKESIEEEGATLDLTSYNDAQIVVMYVEWMWRRRDTMEQMPRMLRYKLNNRILSEKMKND